MKRFAAVSGLAAVLLAGVAASADAQETKPINLSLRAGLFFPSDSKARDEENAWFAFGAEYKLKDLHFGQYQPGYSAALTLSVDHYSQGDFYHTPVLVNYVGRVNQFYYSAGAGLGWTQVPGVLKNDTSNLFAYGLGVGYDFQHGSLPVFIEARYWGSSETKLNGFGVYLGVRL